MEKHKVNFICDGREYCATFDADYEVTSIYSLFEHRYLNVDSEACVRERPHVWTVAYAVMGD